MPLEFGFGMMKNRLANRTHLLRFCGTFQPCFLFCRIRIVIAARSFLFYHCHIIALLMAYNACAVMCFFLFLFSFSFCTSTQSVCWHCHYCCYYNCNCRSFSMPFSLSACVCVFGASF